MNLIDPEWYRASRAHVDRLSGDHRDHVKDYTGALHGTINQWLRNPKGKSRETADIARSRVKSFDAVLAANPLTSETRLTRHTRLSSFGLVDGSGVEKIVAEPRVEDAFISTSRKRVFDVKRVPDLIILDVAVPPGTPAAALEGISKVPRQYEILLGRRLRYYLLDPRYDDTANAWRATMRILGPAKEGE